MYHEEREGFTIISVKLSLSLFLCYGFIIMLKFMINLSHKISEIVFGHLSIWNLNILSTNYLVTLIDPTEVVGILAYK